MLYGILIGIGIYSIIATALAFTTLDEVIIITILIGPFGWLIAGFMQIYKVFYKYYYQVLVEHDGIIYHCQRKEYNWLCSLDGWDRHPNYRQFIDKARYWRKPNKWIKGDGELFLSIKHTPCKIWKNYPAVPKEILDKAKYAYDNDEIDDLGV